MLNSTGSLEFQATNRSRTDTLSNSLIKKVEGWLLNSGAEEIAKWSHRYLEHAGSSQDREAIAHIQVTNNKITAAIRDVARVTEALSADILGMSGRMKALILILATWNRVLLQFSARSEFGVAMIATGWRRSVTGEKAKRRRGVVRPRSSSGCVPSAPVPGRQVGHGSL